jgi:uncharacterized membrane protein YphA (DoxX/SURF4 family)
MSRALVLDVVSLLARLVLGGVYLYTGLSKALQPTDFLKLLREYPVLAESSLLNSVAIILPWFEVFCAVLLLAGIGIRGTGLVSLAMLIPFTALVLQRALAIHASSDTAFCDIRFDCGCGTGEVIICYKLLENLLMIGLSAWLLAMRHGKWALRPNLFTHIGTQPG